MSCTFIPARLSDNRFLRDTDYRGAADEPAGAAALQAAERRFPRRPRGRARTRSSRGPGSSAAQKHWTPDGGRGVKMTTLGVDVAQGGADETVLAALHGTWFAPLIKRRGIDTTNGPAVAALVIEQMRDGAQVNIDLTGGWGGSARDHLWRRASGSSRWCSRKARPSGRGTGSSPSPTGARSCGGNSARRSTRYRATASRCRRTAARGAARGADLEAARQRDRDREQGRHPQAARHVDRRRRRRDPRVAQARRRVAAADEAAAASRAGRSASDGWECEMDEHERKCA